MRCQTGGIKLSGCDREVAGSPLECNKIVELAGLLGSCLRRVTCTGCSKWGSQGSQETWRGTAHTKVLEQEGIKIFCKTAGRSMSVLHRNQEMRGPMHLPSVTLPDFLWGLRGLSSRILTAPHDIGTDFGIPFFQVGKPRHPARPLAGTWKNWGGDPAISLAGYKEEFLSQAQP